MTETADSPTPQTLAAMLEQGVALHRQGRLAEADAVYHDVLRRQPGQFDALHLSGVVALQTGQAARGVELIGQALASNPDSALAYSNRGNGLRDLRRHAEAVASYDRAIALAPDFAVAWSNRGVSLHDLGRYEEALISLDRAIALEPGFAATHFDRGNTLTELKRFDEAIASFDRAIALSPGEAKFHSNRGVALAWLGHNEEAIAGYDRAIALKPDYGEAYSHRGAALEELGQYDEAIVAYEKAIALKPDFAEASFNLSLCLLLLGQFARGWQLYEARKKTARPVGNRAYPQPQWLGDADVAGKTVLIHAEGGYGDTIQFCRYAGQVRALGAHVILAVQPPLVPLLSQMGPDIRVVGLDQMPPAFDVHCPMMSLPLVFKTTPETIPAERVYLRPDAQHHAGWEARLRPRTKPRIGLAWSGSAAHVNDRGRSIALTTLLPLLDHDADWTCLQNTLRPEDEVVLRRDGRIGFHGHDLHDFADTAALIDLMDLVVTVDTSVVHLAAAMGKDVWVMLPFNPDWRWQLGRADSPWYPTVRLFRQRTAGDWAGVIEAVREALELVD